MPTVAVRVAGAVLIAALCGAAGLRAQQPTFRTGVRTVAVYATVQDDNGALVPDLSRGDFEVFEDGARRDVVQFSNDPQPLNVAIMMLTGAGMLSRPVPLASRVQYRDALLGFVDALHPDDRARIGTFGLQIALGAHLTNDRAELRRVLDEEIWAGGGNPLWQAVFAAMRSLESEPPRRVVLVLTSAAPVTRVPTFPGNRTDVAAQAARCACMLYAVTLGARDLTEDLKDIAGASGGGYLHVPEGADLRATFLRIAEELRHQYLIGFEPAAADGAAHRIDVRVTRPGLVVRARQSFTAEAK